MALGVERYANDGQRVIREQRGCGILTSANRLASCALRSYHGFGNAQSHGASVRVRGSVRVEFVLRRWILFTYILTELYFQHTVTEIERVFGAPDAVIVQPKLVRNIILYPLAGLKMGLVVDQWVVAPVVMRLAEMVAVVFMMSAA